MLFRKIPPKNVICFFSFTFESQAHCTAPLHTGKHYVSQWSVHVFHAASFAYRPDLLLAKVIGRVTCREMLMENWRMTGVLNRFEETQKYAYLYKRKLDYLLLHILWSSPESSPDTTWDTNGAEIMSNCETARVQLLLYIDFVQTAAHNNSPNQQLLLRISGSAGSVCTVSAEDISTGFWEIKILSPQPVFPDLALLKPFHFWAQVIHWACIPTEPLKWNGIEARTILREKTLRG